jgi:hypothetical protein
VGFIGLKRVGSGVHAEFALIKLTPPLPWDRAFWGSHPDIEFTARFLDDRGGTYETSFFYTDDTRAVQLPRGFVWRVSESTPIPALAFGHITTVVINGRQVDPLGEGFRWDNRRITGDNVLEFGAERRSMAFPQLAVTPLGLMPKGSQVCMLVRFRNFSYTDVHLFVDVWPDDPGREVTDGTGLTVPGDQSSEVCLPTGASVESAADIQTYFLLLGPRYELFLIPDREAVGSRLAPPVVEVAYRNHCGECGMEVTVSKVQLPPGRFRAKITIKNTGERGTITLPGGTVAGGGRLPNYSTVFMFDEARASSFGRQFNELGFQLVMSRLDQLLMGVPLEFIDFDAGSFPSLELKPGESVSGWLSSENPLRSETVAIILLLGEFMAEVADAAGRQKFGWVSIQEGRPFIELQGR